MIVATNLGPKPAAALVRLRDEAKEANKRGAFSVTHKSITPPSGDSHDYLSFSRYWWPDPAKEDGLPYIRRDGVVNRKLLANGDRNRLGEFIDCVQALTLAGYILDKPEYSRRAAKLVRVWFLEPETKMNPNLNFSQGVPGRAVGRGPGIIDTRGFMLVLDCVELWEGTDFWADDDQAKLQAWFRDFTAWLKQDELGIHEANAKNNHGSWYDAQLARYASFSGDNATARAVLEQAKLRRLNDQFDPDGWQAEELKRTRSLHYSLFNISALVTLARVGDRVGVDLWEYQPENGCGLRKSIDLLVPYLNGSEPWPHQQLEPFKLSPASHVTLRLLSHKYGDGKYAALTNQIEMRHQQRDFARLLVNEVD